MENQLLALAFIYIICTNTLAQTLNPTVYNTPGNTGTRVITGGVNYLPYTTFTYSYYGALAGQSLRYVKSLFVATTRYSAAHSFPLIWTVNIFS